MTTPTIRAALERLIQAIDGIELEGVPEVDDALTAARAALAAAPEGEGPSDWLTVALVAQDMRSRGLAEQVCADELLKLANSNRSQPACPAAPPTPPEGEAEELVEWLSDQSVHLRKMQEIGALPETELQEMLDRAATLLEQQAAELARLRSAPAVVPQPAPLAGLTAAQLQVLRDVLWSAQDEGPPGEGWASRQLQELREIVDAWQSAPPAVVPVAVSERLPGEGRCWWGDAGGAGFVPSWLLTEPQGGEVEA